MHMSDALVSPAVGGAMLLVSAAAVALCSSRMSRSASDGKAPLMGVLGAFLFAAQMINFAIPGTGSSGHLGGGMLLILLLGPSAAFLVVASVLVVQAFFFADGGLLALGCNIFNLAFIPAFIVYPLVYSSIAGDSAAGFRRSAAIIVSSVAALQLGALAVVLETLFSGISSLPFASFAGLMLPVHLPIGLVEGVVTVSIVSFLSKARPEIFIRQAELSGVNGRWTRIVFAGFFIAFILVAGGLSLFASGKPDGLEWSIAGVTGKDSIATTSGVVHRIAAGLQENLGLFPDYDFRKKGSAVEPVNAGKGIGTAVSGVAGGILTLVVAFSVAILIKRFSRRGFAPGISE